MDKDWVRWTRENFVRPLRALLQPSLGEVRIFLDEQIETGADWPAHLARALARSRLLIPILSRNYFESDWCQLELALMLDRERRCGLRSQANPQGLILPFIIDDGDTFPPQVQSIQGERIDEFAQPFMVNSGHTQEKFAERLRECCPDVETAIRRAPPFDQAWESIAHAQFQGAFEAHVEAQTTVPLLSLNHSVDAEPVP